VDRDQRALALSRCELFRFADEPAFATAATTLAFAAADIFVPRTAVNVGRFFFAYVPSTSERALDFASRTSVRPSATAARIMRFDGRPLQVFGCIDAHVPNARSAPDQDAVRIRQPCAAIETQVHVAAIGSDVAERFLQAIAERVRSGDRVIRVIDQLVGFRRSCEHRGSRGEEKPADRRIVRFEERAKSGRRLAHRRPSRDRSSNVSRTVAADAPPAQRLPA
jgi:hypothetical protein